MEDFLSIDEAARACSVSRDTIKRRLRKGEFPTAIRGEPVGDRPPPWLIPVAALVEAGLNPVCAARMDSGVDRNDPVALREALARYEALAVAREAHMADLRSEIRRLHDRLDTVMAMTLRATRDHTDITRDHPSTHRASSPQILMEDHR